MALRLSTLSYKVVCWVCMRTTWTTWHIIPSPMCFNYTWRAEVYFRDIATWVDLSVHCFINCMFSWWYPLKIFSPRRFYFELKSPSEFLFRNNTLIPSRSGPTSLLSSPPTPSRFSRFLPYTQPPDYLPFLSHLYHTPPSPPIVFER